MVCRNQGRFSFCPLYLNGKKPALNLEVAVFGVTVLFLPTRGVFVGSGTAGEFLESGFRIDGNILPVAISAGYVPVLQGYRNARDASPS